MKKDQSKPFHVSSKKYGSGDFYGTGVRAKIGTFRDGSTPGFEEISPSKLKKPPKSLA